MSFARFIESASTPATPPTGQVRVFINASGNLASVDDTGAVTVYSAGITQEQVEDIVGALLQDSSTVDVTYNDAGNAVSFAVIAGGVNHNALLNYVANQHVDHSTVSIIAGTGLTGGGDITASRTLNLANVGTAGTFGSATTIPVITTNAQGQVSGVTNTLIAIPSTQVTGFDEAAQDAVGGILTDSSSIDFTYSDGGNSIQAAVIPGGVDHNGLLNLTTGNPHTQYLLTSTAATTYQPLDSDLTAVAGLAGTGLIARTGTGTAVTRTITAGTGISVTNGDGVSGNPTAAITNTGVTAATYGSATQVPQIAINAQGQTTSASNVSIALPLSQITQSGATTNQVPQWSGSAWVPASITSGNLPTVTSAARLALSPVQGQQVYDTDLNAVCTFVSPSWIYETVVRSTSITSTTNNFFGIVPDLITASLEVGFYEFRCVLITQTVSPGLGLGTRLTSIGGTATATVLANWFWPESASPGLDAFSQWLQEANGDDGTSINAPFANQSFLCTGSGQFQITGAGTVGIALRSELFGSAVSIRPGSILIIRKVN